MKITVDTAQDSAESIRKAIRLLQALVEHDASHGSRNVFDSPEAALPGNAAGSPAAAFGSLFSDDRPAENSKEPEIEFY
jgi:hypothetical protein